MVTVTTVSTGVTTGDAEEFEVQFEVLIPVGAPGVTLTPEEAQSKLAQADVARLLAEMQANLDTETGEVKKFKVVPDTDPVTVKGPVQLNELTIVVPGQAATTTGGDEEA